MSRFESLSVLYSRYDIFYQELNVVGAVPVRKKYIQFLTKGERGQGRINFPCSAS